VVEATLFGLVMCFGSGAKVGGEKFMRREKREIFGI
jgi:hypothetical protein